MKREPTFFLRINTTLIIVIWIALASSRLAVAVIGEFQQSKENGVSSQADTAHEAIRSVETEEPSDDDLLAPTAIR